MIFVLFSAKNGPLTAFQLWACAWSVSANSQLEKGPRSDCNPKSIGQRAAKENFRCVYALVCPASVRRLVVNRLPDTRVERKPTALQIAGRCVLPGWSSPTSEIYVNAGSAALLLTKVRAGQTSETATLGARRSRTWT